MVSFFVIYSLLHVQYRYASFGGFSGGSDGAESACNAGDLDLIPGSGRSPGGGHGNPLQYSCLEKSHGQRSLAGYGPWGRKELDTTEQLSKHMRLLLGGLQFTCVVLEEGYTPL